MRVSMPTRGSVMVIVRLPSPARLHETGHHPGRRKIAERDARHLELAVHAARSAGDLATVANAHRRAVARQRSKLQSRLETLFQRQALVVGDALQFGSLAREPRHHLAPPVVLLDRTLLCHLGCPTGGTENRMP